MANNEIREAAKAARVRLWQVAEELGMCDTVFSRRLRHELSEKDKHEALAAIHRLAEEVQR